jgi:hypothetical protein
MLEAAGAMAKIRPEDLFFSPKEAVVDYLSTQHDAAGIVELLRSAAHVVRSLLQPSLATAPVERQAAIAAIVDRLDQEVVGSEITQEVSH